MRWIGITSGYRSARRQFSIWQTNFPRYYGETASQRAAASGGPHGDAAVRLMVSYVGNRVAAPGFSLHNNGRAADLKTSERNLTLGVVIHFHGYSSQRDARNIVTDKLPASGLDPRDPDDPASAARTRPTLFILPRGNFDKTKGGGTGYTFPALVPDQALRELWSFALEQLASHLGLPERPRIARLILTAHSGGGAALEQVLKNYDPTEVHVFDALYHPAPNLVKWAKKHIETDADPASTAQPGALRVFYLPGTKTESFSLTVRQAIRKALHGRPSAPALAQRYRVQTASGGHPTVAHRYGWQLLVDPAAQVK